MKCSVIRLLAAVTCLYPFPSIAGNELLMLDLEDLSQVRVEENTATLTSSSARETPATVTVITHEQIEASGARSLDELLDIFVPSFAYMYKVHGTQMGIRGIISDRNNKILLLVNGRNMNIKATDGGALTERWTSTLDDIDRVTVINGPGSAVFGPGAIAGVISIETFDGFKFQGSDVHVRAGAGERFLSAQLRHGEKLSDRWALFLYYGLEQASGADDDEAPHKLAFDMTIERPSYGTSVTIEANRNFPFETTPEGASYHAKPRHKAHIQLDSENLSLWARFTQSGQAMPTLQNLYRYPYNDYGYNYPDIFHDTGNEHKQWTLYGKYTQNLSPTLSVEYSASYMQSELNNKTLNNEISGKAWKEKDTLLDAVVRYTPSTLHAFAVGLSYDDTRFTNERKLLPGDFESIGSWSSDLISAYGEYQGKVGDRTTVFAGIRFDRHTYSPWMFSPRLALIYMPDLSSTLKFIYNHSVRHSDDADLYAIHLQTGKDGDVEKIDHFEGIYCYDFDEKSGIDLSIYYNRHHVVSYVQESARQEHIGTLTFYGIEAQYRYDTENLSLFLSHSYTKQIDFDLADPTYTYQNISASPYGYGNDLANWNTHLTKFHAQWHASTSLLWSGSLRVYWGMPGAKDMADYNMAAANPNPLLPIYTDGTNVFETSIFLDLGVRYSLNDKTEISLYGYDLLGLFDEDLNKRNFFQRTSHYRDTAPSVAIGLKYQF